MPDKDKKRSSSPIPLSERVNRLAPDGQMKADTQSNNPLHGVKLVDMLEYLVSSYGWEELGRRINIRCFNYDPSVKSSLAFLRKTPWARDKVEQLYLNAVKNRKKL